MLGCSEPSVRSDLEPRAARVTDTTALVADEVVRIETDGETLVATPEHPFARIGSGWARADELVSGDVIESARERGPVTVHTVRKSRVTPTRVYNLSVAPSRAYYVGRDRLLVHNTDCGRPRAPIVDDTPELRQHCSYCLLAALSDRSVTQLERERGIQANEDGLLTSEFQDLMLQLGIISEDSRFAQWTRAETSQTGRTIPDVVEEYMRNNPQSNTFAISYMREIRVERPRGSGRIVSVMAGHGITAVRQEDGGILYIDFVGRPPRTSRSLNPDTEVLIVWPTNTDYRFNRHMHHAIRNGRSVNVMR
jgi:hypothetical protein